MSQSSESFVPVPTLSSGTNVRNLTITLVDSDGQPRAVNMQVVSIKDEDGYKIDLSGERQTTLLRSILRELRAQNLMLSAAYGQAYVQPPSDDQG